jgi:energy-coupling factor transporter ATP-binding protein EcfA2
MRALALDPLSKALRDAIRAFLELFETEYQLREPLTTLLEESVKKSVAAFIASEAVQELLAEPVRQDTALRIAELKALWKELKDADNHELTILPDGFDWDAVGSAYLNRVHSIVATAPELRSIWLANNVNEIKHILGSLREPAPQLSLDQYRKIIIEEFGTVKLSAMRVDADTSRHDQSISLDDIYIPQRVKEAFPPLDLSRDYRRRLEFESRLYGVPNDEVRGRAASEYENAPVLQLRAVLEDPSSTRFVILGDPGLGKSTLVQHLALDWAHRRSNVLPIIVELRKYTRDHAHPRSFLEFLEFGTWSHCRISQRELSGWLNAKDCLVLFDGLDEIFEESLRGNIVTEIINFARSYSRAKIIVTTRVIGYAVGSPNPELFQAAGFRQFTLQDFDDDEITEFVDKWHQNTLGQTQVEREQLKRRLNSAIKEFEAIHELAANPLLLTMMALLNRRKHLPRERLKLYESCAELLIEGWDAARHLEPSAYLGHDDKVEILQRVAFEMQQEPEGIAGNMISEARLKTILVGALRDRDIINPKLTAKKIVDALAERDFMLCFIGDQQFAFVHRTFLEYFCAKEYKTHLENAGDADELVQLFRTRWSDDTWHEVLRLICAMVGPDLAGTLVNELLSSEKGSDGWRATFLAADCLAEIRQSGRVNRERTACRDQLIELLGYKYISGLMIRANPAIEIRVGAVNRLAHGWPDEDTHQLLKDTIQDQFWRVRSAAVGELIRLWGDDSTRQWLTRQAAVAQWGARQAALQGLAVTWPDDTTQQLLIKHIESDESLAVRSEAFQKLLNLWPEEATYQRLVQRATLSNYEDIREKAIRELGKRWREDKLRQFLKERLTQDKSPRVRRSAALELSRLWRDESTLQWLMEHTSPSQHDATRQAALHAVAARWKSEMIRQTLLSYLQDQSSDVRAAALNGIVRYSEDDDAIKNLLLDRARNEDDSQVRRDIVMNLGGLPNDELKWNCLATLAISDPAPRVRLAALISLNSKQDDTRFRDLLLSRATEDTDDNIRMRVLDELLQTWPADPRVLDLVSRRSQSDIRKAKAP